VGKTPVSILPDRKGFYAGSFVDKHSHKYTSERAVTCDADISPTTPLKFNRK